jgi:hypothetical protein
VVKAFLEMPEDYWTNLRKEIDARVHAFAYSAAKG